MTPSLENAICEETLRPKRERESQISPAWKRERGKRTLDGGAEQGSGEESEEGYHDAYERRTRRMTSKKPHRPWLAVT